MEALRTIECGPTCYPAQTNGVGQTISAVARARLLSKPGEPLFIADWLRAVMIHYEVDPAALQQVVPFALDLRNGRAFVSTVAFTLNAMRPRLGGRLSAWLMKPISTHDFLNVRTYVCVDGEPGIYFLAEWLSNRLSVLLGPRAFGLPYRFGKIEYHHEWGPSRPAQIRGQVTDLRTKSCFAYEANLTDGSVLHECEAGSHSKWLMERYTAFTKVGAKRRFFRVWHQPWPQTPVDVSVRSKNLLDENWPLFRDARIIGANFSPGVTNVWMGWPRRVSN